MVVMSDVTSIVLGKHPLFIEQYYLFCGNIVSSGLETSWRCAWHLGKVIRGYDGTCAAISL